MPVSYRHAPLIEVIAEVRWSFEPPQPIPEFIVPDSSTENLFSRLGGELDRLGFRRSERLFPTGSPVMSGGPAIRYKTDDVNLSSVAYQAGPSVFSIHAIKPYVNWENFLPSVRIGVDALLLARTDLMVGTSLNRFTLRYINFFGPRFIPDKETTRFISDVLGFCTTQPEAARTVVAEREAKSLLIKLETPVDGGMLNVGVGDATHGSEFGVILDLAVASTNTVEPNSTDVINVFERAHRQLHTLFDGLTRSIATQMEPTEC